MGVSCGRGKMEFPEEPFMGGLPDKTEANCEGYDAKRYHLLDGILSKRGEFRKRNPPPSLYKSLSISKVIHIYIYYVYRSVLFLLAQANRMAHVSHFWN